MSDEDEVFEVVTFPDLDEAIAHAMADVGEGCIVSIHATDCELSEDGEDESQSCTCVPLDLVVGAKA